LYCINQTDTEYLGKKIPLLSTRISALSSSGNILWIATYGNGVIAFADNKIVAHITAENGLTSNMCRNWRLQENSFGLAQTKV
jgi:hypothetical protein